jgi:hypothetical protein
MTAVKRIPKEPVPTLIDRVVRGNWSARVFSAWGSKTTGGNKCEI